MWEPTVLSKNKTKQTKTSNFTILEGVGLNIHYLETITVQMTLVVCIRK